MGERDDDKLTIIGGYVVNTPSADELARLRAVEAAAREVIDNSKHIEDYDVPSHLIRAIDTLRLSLGSLREGG